MLRRTFLTASLAVCALGPMGGAASAQTYPSQPIRFVVPFAAGSATDTLARILAQRLSAANGWTVVVENMAGASGMIAAQNVARAAPDGYTVFITSNTTHASNANMFKKLPYDPVADFAPIGRLGDITLALALHPSVPAINMRELIAYAKANPGKLTFGSGSASSRIAGEMLKTMAGINMVHVPYRSNPMAIADLLGGQIQIVFADVSTTLPQIAAGKVKGLGVSSAKRTSLAPDLPTMQEAGVPGYELTAWFAAFVPAKTPQPIVERLNKALNDALNVEAVKAALLKVGVEPVTSTPQELAAFAEAETKKWAEIVKAAGIEPE